MELGRREDGFCMCCWEEKGWRGGKFRGVAKEV